MNDVALEFQRYGRNKNTLVNKTYLENGEYRRKFDQISDNIAVNRSLYLKSKEALQHRSGTAYEDMFWIDEKTGTVILEMTDSHVERAILYTDRIQKIVKSNNNIITLHTHPSSMPPSISDFNSCFRNNYNRGIIACHNGKIFVYNSDENVNETLYYMYIASYLNEGADEFSAQMKTIERLKQNYQIDFWEAK